MMGYGIKVKFRDDDWAWYEYDGTSQKTGVRRVTFHTIEEGEEWCKTFNIEGKVVEYDVSSFCKHREDLFYKCNFCDCWKEFNA
jgi:hypothetical protein